MSYSNDFPQVVKVNGKKAIFLLGTDQYIGEGLDENGYRKETESRVGVAPHQVEEIRGWLAEHGVALDFYFLKGAGVRADFLDSSYLKIGGNVLFEHQLASMPAPHVVHALKEPCAYETFIPGPFCRIGALHSGAFNDESGVAFLFEQRNFAAIFDGSSIGTDAHIPIRGAMSVFAGEIAAEFTVKHLKELGKKEATVYISGGGVVGSASLRILLEENATWIRKVVVVDPGEAALERIQNSFGKDMRVSVIKGGAITAQMLAGCDGVILTAFIKGRSAPDVVSVTDLEAMNNNGIVVDVSIDERGGVKVDGFKKENHSLPQVVNTVAKAIENLGKGIKYVADDHLPKHRPKKASIAHGDAIKPYIGMLLYLSAITGGPRQAVRYIMSGNYADLSVQAGEILRHLKRGLAFISPAPVMYNRMIINETVNKQRLEEFFSDQGIEFDSYDN